MGHTCDRGCKSSLSFEGRLDATVCTLMAHLPMTSQGGTSLSIKARPPPMSVRHYMPAQLQGHHAIDHPEERGVERGSARRSSLKGQERAIINQMNIGTVSKAKLGKLLRDGVECIIMGFFRVHRYHLELK